MNAAELIFLLLLFAPTMFAQTRTTPASKAATPPSKASIYLGTTELSLDMPRDVVLANLAIDFKLTKTSDGGNRGSESWEVLTNTFPARARGNVQFINKKLWSISKNWEPENEGETIPFLKSLYGAFAAVQKEEDNSGVRGVFCFVHTESTQTPVELQKVEVHCNPKLLTVYTITANSKSLSDNVIVEETLRGPNSPQK